MIDRLRPDDACLASSSVASEIYPLVKTGGLADVAGALPAALARRASRCARWCRAIPPCCSALDGADASSLPICSAARRGCSPAAHDGLDLFVLDAPHLYARPGNPYVGAGRRGLAGQRRALRRAGAGRRPISATAAFAGCVPDIVHAHDWQAGLAPAYLHYAAAPRPGDRDDRAQSGLPGAVPAELLGALGLPRARVRRRRRRVSTAASVSSRPGCNSPTASPRSRRPTRRRSRPTRAAWGSTACCARARTVLTGILNGIDDAVWNPATDRIVPAAYGAEDARRRAAANKAALQQRLRSGRRSRRRSLLGVVSRLTWQKGLDLLLEAMPDYPAARRAARAARQRRPRSAGSLRGRCARASRPGRLRHRL